MPASLIRCWKVGSTVAGESAITLPMRYEPSVPVITPVRPPDAGRAKMAVTKLASWEAVAWRIQPMSPPVEAVVSVENCLATVAKAVPAWSWVRAVWAACWAFVLSASTTVPPVPVGVGERDPLLLGELALELVVDHRVHDGARDVLLLARDGAVLTVEVRLADPAGGQVVAQLRDLVA